MRVNDEYILSNSEVQAFKHCLRKWWLTWYRRLVYMNEGYDSPRATGNRVHRALEKWYVPEGQTKVDPREALEEVIKEDWLAYHQEMAERGFDEYQIAEQAVKLQSSIELERVMVAGYVDWLTETGADADYEVIGSEQQLAAWLYPHARSPEPVKLVGILDARVRRLTDGARMFIDHKTVGNFTDPLKTLLMNEQMLHYLFLEFLTTEDFDKRCDGAVYNMIRRVKRTPRATPPFYMRHEVRHNVNELRSYRQRISAEAAAILDIVHKLDNGWDVEDVIYPSPSKTCTWGCDFFAICPMFDDGSRVEDAISTLYKETDPLSRYDRCTVTKDGS